LECLLDPVGVSSLQVRIDMGVGVADLRVTEDLHHSTRRNALGQQDAGGGVAQIVETDAAEFGSTQQGLEGSVVVAWMDGVPVAVVNTNSFGDHVWLITSYSAC
jgi:hypothetical protein